MDNEIKKAVLLSTFGDNKDEIIDFLIDRQDFLNKAYNNLLEEVDMLNSKNNEIIIEHKKKFGILLKK